MLFHGIAQKKVQEWKYHAIWWSNCQCHLFYQINILKHTFFYFSTCFFLVRNIHLRIWWWEVSPLDSRHWLPHRPLWNTWTSSRISDSVQALWGVRGVLHNHWFWYISLVERRALASDNPRQSCGLESLWNSVKHSGFSIDVYEERSRNMDSTSYFSAFINSAV